MRDPNSALRLEARACAASGTRACAVPRAHRVRQLALARLFREFALARLLGARACAAPSRSWRLRGFKSSRLRGCCGGGYMWAVSFWKPSGLRDAKHEFASSLGPDGHILETTRKIRKAEISINQKRSAAGTKNRFSVPRHSAANPPQIRGKPVANYRIKPTSAPQIGHFWLQWPKAMVF